MAKRIELPEGGQYIEVKEAGELRHGDIKAVKAAVPVSVDQSNGTAQIPGDYNERTRDALAARIITGWNLQWPIPNGDPSVLDNLLPNQIDALYAGIEEHMKAVQEANAQNAKGVNPTNGASAA